MKSKSPYFSLFGMVMACVFFFTSCIKVPTKTTDYADASTSHSTTDNMLKDINKVIGDAAADGNISGKMEGLSNNTCATITLSPSDLTTFPKTVTIDFGSGCTDQYGVTRSGVVTAVFTDYLHVPGSHEHVTFSNYFVNGNHVEGVYDLANTSPAGNTSRSFVDTITNGKITRTDGKVCTWNATRYSNQTGGFSTPVLNDDEYTGGGNSEGIGFNSKPFTAVSTNVVWKLACKYLVSGTVVIHSNNDPKPITVDFGNGACDNKYNVAYDIYNVDLTFWY